MRRSRDRKHGRILAGLMMLHGSHGLETSAHNTAACRARELPCDLILNIQERPSALSVLC